jgi:hypothetical protein
MRFALLKTNLCVLLLCFFSIAASAQSYTDVVYLKNGTIVRGIIIEQVPGKTIKVQTADALKIEINYSDIEKISKETSITSKDAAITPGTPNNTSAPAVAPKPALKKYFFTAGAGFFSGDGIGYTGRISVGLRLGKNFDLQAFYQLSEADRGLTRGARQEKYNRLSMQNYGIKGSFTIPTTSSVHPYFSIGTGYSRTPFTTSGRAFNEEYGGSGAGYGYYNSFFINPAFGLSVPIGKNNSLFTEVNYNYHSWKDVHSFWGNPPANYPKPYSKAQFASLLVGVKF